MAASIRLLAEFFHGTATQLEAGLAIEEILAAQSAALGRGRFGAEIERWRSGVASGGTWSEGLKQSGGYLPAGTAAVISAGERTGRLAQCCQLLADDFEQRGKLARTLVAMSWYPMLVLIVALGLAGLLLFLNPVGKLEASLTNRPGQTAAVAAQSQARGELFLWVVAGTAAAGLGGLIAWRLVWPHTWYGLMPLNPRLAWRQASMQFFRTWHMGASAGLLAPDALAIAADSIAQPGYRRKIHRLAEEVRERRIPPSQVLGPSRFVDAVELQQILTMEKTGNVDDTLGRLATAAGERFTRSMKLWMGFLIGLLIVVVLGFVIWQIIGFFLSYVGLWDIKKYK